MAGDPTPIGASATLYVYPNTLQDLTLTVKPGENGSILQTLTLSDGTIDDSSYPGALKFSITKISSMGKYTSGIVIAESTGCQTQTANVQAVVVAGTDESITMEPASGYEKMFAWKAEDCYEENDHSKPLILYTYSNTSVGDNIYTANGEVWNGHCWNAEPCTCNSLIISKTENTIELGDIPEPVIPSRP